MRRNAMAGFALLAGIAALSMTRCAWADDDTSPHTTVINLSARTGFFNDDASDKTTNVGNDWWVLSLGYDLMQPKRSRNGTLSTYMDYGLGFGAVTIENQYKVQYQHQTWRTFFGLGLSARMHFTPPNGTLGLYATAGAGLYRLGRGDDTADGIAIGGDGGFFSTVNETGISSNATIHPGFKLGGGLSFRGGYSLEGNYFALGRLDGVEYRGVSVTIGSLF